jgi:hypothetical protein
LRKIRPLASQTQAEETEVLLSCRVIALSFAALP